VNAALAWSTLGYKWLEMMTASGHVIARRSRRKPSYGQLYGMGSEKVEAMLASSNAMTRQMIGFPTGDPFAMWQAWARVLGSGMQPFHSRAVRNARGGRRRR
jgi:hypothetical protein